MNCWNTDRDVEKYEQKEMSIIHQNRLYIETSIVIIIALELLNTITATMVIYKTIM